MPSATNFVILNSRRDTICSGKTDANGLASISFIPDGNRYLLSTETDDKATHNFLLPETMPTPTLRAAINRERLVCYALADTDDKDPIDSLEIAIYHSSFGIKKLNLRKGVCMADLSGCTPGLITLWLCNKAGNILAQRVLRIGGSNISTSTNDTIGKSSVFVRFLPEKAGKITTAFEMLNFTDELLSPVPFPETYSDSSNIQTDQNINTWLLSASNKMIGADALRADSIPYKYPIEQALCISGVVRNGKRPLQNANVQIYNVQNNDAVSVSTDATGHFNATVNDFVNGSKLYIQAYNSKGKTGTFTYQLDEEDYPPVTDISYNVPFAQELTDENLAKIIEPIDTGDFNVDQNNEIYAIFTNSGLLRDSYTAARLRYAENGTFNAYNNDTYTDSRIDHVFVSSNFLVDNYAILTDCYWTAPKVDEANKASDAPQEIDFRPAQRRLPSDHYPVFVKLKMK
jgi:hypothetical protein